MFARVVMLLSVPVGLLDCVAFVLIMYCIVGYF